MLELISDNGEVINRYSSFADRIEAFTWRQPGGVMDPVSAILVNNEMVYPDKGGGIVHSELSVTMHYEEPFDDYLGVIYPYDIDKKTRVRDGVYVGECVVFATELGPTRAIAMSYGPINQHGDAIGHMLFTFDGFNHHSSLGYKITYNSSHLGRYSCSDTDGMVSYDHYYLLDDGTQVHSNHVENGFIVWGWAQNGLLFHTFGIAYITVAGSFVRDVPFDSYSQVTRPYISSVSGPAFLCSSSDGNGIAQGAIDYVCGTE